MDFFFDCNSPSHYTIASMTDQDQIDESVTQGW